MDANEERNLLFAATAVQAGLITPDQLAQACAARCASRGKPLLQTLCEKGWLLPADLAHLEYLAERRLAGYAGDIRASFSGYPADLRRVLATACEGPGEARGRVHDTIAYDAAGPVPAPAPAARAGPRYTLSALHAAGGIGEIWVARDEELGRDVAVKRLQARNAPSAATRTRFLHEAKITGQLDHPGVVPIYEICIDEADGQPYYAMRLLKGGTLTDAVREYHQQRKAGAGNLQRFLALLNAFCTVCNTVAYAHSKGVIHRDLKGDNVILGDYGDVVVIDWGLAKEVGRAEGAAEAAEGHGEIADAGPLATLAGQVLGTPAYMAPEQAQGRQDLVGPASDVYGLSAILYEVLCGEPPFIGRTTLDVLRKVQHDAPAPPSEVAPGVPAALERLCLTGLAKEPSERHPSAQALAQAVQAWVSDLAERRQAEEERERFFALSLDLLAIIDDAGCLRQVSPAWERLLGYGRAQLDGQPFLDFIHADDRPATERCLKAADTFEARAAHRDGGWLWVSWNVTPIHREQCVYAVGRDITELKKSQQLFEGVLQSAPDAMVLLNVSGRIVMVNRQAERVFGYRPEEMLGQPVEILIPERYRAGHPAHVARFFATSSVRPMGAGLPLRGLRKDGVEFAADIALSPIATEAGPLVAASVRDVSDRAPR